MFLSYWKTANVQFFDRDLVSGKWPWLAEQSAVKTMRLFFFIWYRVMRTTCHRNASLTWWRHQMETFSALLAFSVGNSPVPVNSPHKGQWHGALTFSLICVSINGWVNFHEAGDFRRYRVHYDVIVMIPGPLWGQSTGHRLISSRDQWCDLGYWKTVDMSALEFEVFWHHHQCQDLLLYIRCVIMHKNIYRYRNR